MCVFALLPHLIKIVYSPLVLCAFFCLGVCEPRGIMERFGTQTTVGGGSVLQAFAGNEGVPIDTILGRRRLRNRHIAVSVLPIVLEVTGCLGLSARRDAFNV